MAIARHKTALVRPGFSAPIRIALDDGVIDRKATVLDYGCGHGDDVRRLKAQRIRASGWDPVHRPKGKIAPSGVVNLGYVVNVIEDPAERAATLRRAWDYATRVLIVSARLAADAAGTKGVPLQDGLVTRSETFQKFYQQHELRAWIDATLGIQSVAAGPGTFYVFRDEATRQRFIAARYRRRAAMPKRRRSDVVFEEHRKLLEPLMQFFSARGRLPLSWEIPQYSAICEALGSVPRAFAVVRRVTGREPWEKITKERTDDLLVYLALARFDKRPRFGQLPDDQQADVRAFYSTYSQASLAADALLFSAGEMRNIQAACVASAIGKLTPAALYIHESALPHLPPILRVYEGCARAYVGTAAGACMVKLCRDRPRVSYLAYPEFDGSPHPTLAGSLSVRLAPASLRYREFTSNRNPPVLHRKELFVLPTHPRRRLFENLTRAEEAAGLLARSATIGRLAGWNRRLRASRVRLNGHRLVRETASEPGPRHANSVHSATR